VILVALLLPNRYKSHLEILVKNERANSLISGGDQTQGLVYLNDISEAQINTEIELLNSGDLLREAVKRCQLEDLVSPSVIDPQRRLEIAFRDLQAALTVAPAHRSDVIEVTYQSADPKQSARVLRALAELYQALHLKLHGAPGSYAFFDKVWEDTAKQSEAAAEELAAFKQSKQIVSLPEEKTLLLQHITDLQKETETSIASASKSEQEAAAYQKSLSLMQPSIEEGRKSIPNQEATQQLSTILVTLQNKRAEAVTRYRPDDRIVSDLDTQISLTQQAIDKAGRTPAQEVASGINPTFLSAETSLVRANADHAGSVAQAGSLRDQLARDKGRLAQLEAATIAYEELERRSTDLINLRESYRKKRDDARGNELLDKQDLSNVAIVEQPVMETIATSPRRGIIAALGFIWSLVLGALTAVALDLWKRTIQSPVTALALKEAKCFMMLAALPGDANQECLANSYPEVYVAMQRATSAQRGGS
jgi:uncharacterized protein involved in exopolysaccharide biosynthesis